MKFQYREIILMNFLMDYKEIFISFLCLGLLLHLLQLAIEKSFSKPTRSSLYYTFYLIL